MDKNTTKYITKKKKEMQRCHHLFIKTDDNCIRCLKCGLTNERIIMDELSKRKYDLLLIEFDPMLYSFYEMNDKVFNKEMSAGKKINFISEEVLTSNHPHILYKLALHINPLASCEELFIIMKRLDELETPEEKNKINKPEIIDLIDRYNSCLIRKRKTDNDNLL